MTLKRYLISAHIVLMKEDIHKSFIRKHRIGSASVVFIDISSTCVYARERLSAFCINFVSAACRNPRAAYINVDVDEDVNLALDLRLQSRDCSLSRSARRQD